MNADIPSVKNFLDEQYKRFNKLQFIETDPISIPKKFDKVQDIEIAGLWIAVLSWGLRKTIIRKGNELLELLRNSPHEFILHHTPKERIAFENFRHRTFNGTDALYFLEFLQSYYRKNQTLESLFCKPAGNQTSALEEGIIHFHRSFFSLPFAPKRTQKHIATPEKNSCCKRLNMFLRWMVRRDSSGVDFGCWQNIKPSQLYIPLDVHVERVARKLGLIDRSQRDWKTVKELTCNLRKFDPLDPVKYDFALFGTGVLQKGGW